MIGQPPDTLSKLICSLLSFGKKILVTFSNGSITQKDLKGLEERGKSK